MQHFADAGMIATIFCADGKDRLLAQSADGRQAALAERASWWEQRQTALWVALGLLFLLNYGWTIVDLFRGLVARERLVLGLVILAGALYLVWDRRAGALRARVRPSRWGLAFLAFSLVALLVGTRARFVFATGMSSLFICGIAMVSCLCGLVVLLRGWDAMRPLWLPAVLLLFVHPESYLTTSWIPLRLQTLAAVASEKIVSALGTTVVREGHVLETARFVANVEEACSGIRSLMTVIPTALFLGALGLRKAGSKAALVMASVPLAVGANIVRVTGTVLLGVHVSEKVADGFFHYFAGTGIFVLCLIGLLGLVRLLRAIEGPVPSGAEGAGAGLDPTQGSADDPPAAPWPVGAFVAGVAMLLVGAGFQGHTMLGFIRAVRSYPDLPLQGLPYAIRGWTGADLDAEEAAATYRNPSDWIYREYRREGRPPIGVLALCWGPGVGTYADRRVHVPEICYPQHGMVEVSTHTTPVELNTEPPDQVLLRTSVFRTPDAPLVVTSCYMAGGGRLTIPYRIPEGYVAALKWGLGKLFRPDPFGPEMAFQFITPLKTPAEAAIVREHHEFAAWFIPRVVEACAGDD